MFIAKITLKSAAKVTARAKLVQIIAVIKRLDNTKL